jgi:hypothetical protein
MFPAITIGKIMGRSSRGTEPAEAHGGHLDFNAHFNVTLQPTTKQLQNKSQYD